MWRRYNGGEDRAEGSVRINVSRCDSIERWKECRALVSQLGDSVPDGAESVRERKALAYL
jgi:hypothetical protein